MCLGLLLSVSVGAPLLIPVLGLPLWIAVMAPKKRLIPPPSGSALPLQPIPGTCVPQLRAGFDVSKMVHDVGKGLIGIPSVSEAVGGCTFAMGPIEWDPEKEIFRSRPAFSMQPCSFALQTHCVAGAPCQPMVVYLITSSGRPCLELSFLRHGKRLVH